MPLRFRKRVIAHISESETREDNFLILETKYIFSLLHCCPGQHYLGFLIKACCLAMWKMLDTNSKDMQLFFFIWFLNWKPGRTNVLNLVKTRKYFFP